MSYLVLHDSNAVNLDSGKTFLHWIIDDQVRELMRYMPPTPPPGSGDHVYRLVKVQKDMALPYTERHNQIIPDGEEI